MTTVQPQARASATAAAPPPAETETSLIQRFVAVLTPGLRGRGRLAGWPGGRRRPGPVCTWTPPRSSRS